MPKIDNQETVMIEMAEPCCSPIPGAPLEVAEPCCGLILGAPLETAEASELAVSFSALGDPVRLRLLNLLAESPAGAVCVCDLVPAVGKSQPTVSHHLKILGDAGLVSGERRGKWVWYSVNRQRLADLRAALA